MDKKSPQFIIGVILYCLGLLCACIALSNLKTDYFFFFPAGILIAVGNFFIPIRDSEE